jgi:hypothetical protein
MYVSTNFFNRFVWRLYLVEERGKLPETPLWIDQISGTGMTEIHAF